MKNLNSRIYEEITDSACQEVNDKISNVPDNLLTV
jgi:hypothetical protein